LDDACFREASFVGKVSFENSQFAQGADFSLATFSGLDNSFLNAKFAHVPDFLRTNFSRPPDFYCSRIGHLFRPGLNKALTARPFSAPPAKVVQRCDRTNFRAAFTGPLRAKLLSAKPSSEGNSARYRRLKQLANEAKDHEQELTMFAGELRAKRLD